MENLLRCRGVRRAAHKGVFRRLRLLIAPTLQPMQPWPSGSFERGWESLHVVSQAQRLQLFHLLLEPVHLLL